MTQQNTGSQLYSRGGTHNGGSSPEAPECKKLPSTVVLHLVSESLRKEPVGAVITNIKMLAKDLRQKHGARVHISLGLPVDDYELDKKIQATNILLKNEDDIDTICHAAAFTTEGYPNDFLYKDWIRLNRFGNKRLAVNFKKAALK